MKKDHPLGLEKILDVWVQPNASRNEILGFRDGNLRIRVAAPPREGKANQLLREVLAGALGVALSQVEILSGHKTRRKRVRVIGLLPNPDMLEILGMSQEKTH
jgi:uncharacterized protein (TIGR00251 family)